MFSALFSFLGGSVFRMVWGEASAFINKREDHKQELAAGDFAIADFVAPLVEMRNNFKADWTIWMDTIDQGRYEDTNKAFVPPAVYDFRVTELDAGKWAEFIGEHILSNRSRPVFDWQKGNRTDAGAVATLALGAPSPF